MAQAVKTTIQVFSTARRAKQQAIMTPGVMADTVLRQVADRSVRMTAALQLAPQYAVKESRRPRIGPRTSSHRKVIERR